VNILDLKLDAGTIGRFAKPHKQVYVLVTVEEKIIVAAALVCQIVNHVTNAFTLEF